MNIRLLFITFLFVLFFEQSVSAAVRENEEIIVDGRTVKQATKSYVKQVSLPKFNGQYAIWDTPICLEMIGWEPHHGQSIKANIEEIIKDIGHKVGKVGCTPNMGVVLSSDPAKLFKNLRTSVPRQYSELSPEQRRNAEAGQQAVSILMGVDQRSSDGRVLDRDALRPPPALNDLTAYAGLIMNNAHGSLIGNRVKSNFAVGIAVVDVGQIDGATFEGLSSYIALRMLAGMTRDKKPSSGPTILTLFDDLRMENVPLTTLSQWDSAFLRGLYAAPRDETAGAQRHAIVKSMRKTLSEGLDTIEK